MKSFSLASAAAAVFAGASLLTSAVNAATQVDPIVIVGQHFFYKTNGSEFFIRGVAYQSDVSTNGTTSGTATFSDPLADANACARDIPLLQKLQTNVIRVYAINATNDHSACMNMLANAGIYVLQDLSNPSYSIDRSLPSWNTELFASYAAVVDEMQQYTNTLGFFAGNEVSNQANNTDASAFVKAAVRDMKAYIKTKGYRTIGVGYATNDDKDIRIPLADYFNCGDADSAIDFWGYNIYSWCGESSYTLSGYDQRTAEFENYTVPAFFAEYGCNTVPPRLFDEVQAIYGPNMTGVWSGGIVYMYFQETNDYGLVSVDSKGSATTLSDYSRLSTQIAKITPSSTASSAYKVTNTAARACPTQDSIWSASSNLPPIVNPEVCSCMVSSLSCVSASTISSNTTEDLFDYICGTDQEFCTGINANGTTGVYGAYSMCSSDQRLAFIMDQYYVKQGKASTACEFSGHGTTQSPSIAATCTSLLSAAGTGGTGTVTAMATGTGTGTGTGSGSSASGTAASTSTSKAAAGNLVVPRFDTEVVHMGVYVAIALLTGAGMVLL
ncbi:MAG: 1,3-beta-glucanosyltransferase gas1 [Claussenomyces sp. TS43310]|nr:MAG: 1,3-beta-glucanosyltransferase gas1 [Claussenomyces sp. TS43310]